jgi:translation initiation factor IF-2
MGIEVKSQMKSLDEETAAKVIASLKGKADSKKSGAAATTAAVTKKTPAGKKDAAPAKTAPAARKAPAKAKTATTEAKQDKPEPTKTATAPATTGEAPAKAARTGDKPGPAPEPARRANRPPASRPPAGAPARGERPRPGGGMPPRGGRPQHGGGMQGRGGRPQQGGEMQGRGGRPQHGGEMQGRGGRPQHGGGAQGRGGRVQYGDGVQSRGGRPEAEGKSGARRRRVKDKRRRRLSPQDMAPMKPRAAAPTAPTVNEINITEAVNVKELATKMGIRLKDVMQKLMQQGLMVSLNQSIDPEVAVQIAESFGVKAEVVSFEEDLMMESLKNETETTSSIVRHPVVTVMGHVDHGKTSLLDAIRKTNVIGGEAGGITQHIGAYHVPVGDKAVIFLDTPGHEAFTRMRARGADVTDLVILVVAADDGVMPQTIEAINHAKAARVPILVAVNKIDKPGADPMKVKQQLMTHEILTEDLGGDTVSVNISAKQGTGISDLLEMILLVTEMTEHKASEDRSGTGVVLEANLDRGRGPVATVLVQDGSVKVGDHCIAGAFQGKVRAMFDDQGNKVDVVPPSHPVQIIGLQGVPDAGDSFQVVEDAVKANKIATFRKSRLRASALAGDSPRLTLDQLFQQIETGVVKELPVIIKADVQGSVEVLHDALSKLEAKEIKTRTIHSGVGAINENDVLLAAASNAIIIGFNVRPERGAMELAERENVDIRLHNVVYKVTEEIHQAMAGLLDPEYKEKILGHVEVRDTFRVPKAGVIAGCHVSDGLVQRKNNIRLLRDNVVIHEGKISSLRRFKDDVSEVKSGFECGIGIENYNDIKVGDVIQVFIMERIQPQL